MPVTVVATLQVKEGAEAEVEEILRELAAHTHDEAGCLSYALHRDSADPRTFVFVERWTSAIALESHNQQPHLRAAFAKAGDLLAAAPDVKVLEPIAAGDPVKGSL